MTNTRMPSIADFADAEHCVLEDIAPPERAHDAATDPSRPRPRKLRDELSVRDRLRGRLTRIRLYSEGWLDLEIARRGAHAEQLRIDLRFLDSVPSIDRRFPRRLYLASLGAGALTGLLAITAAFGLLASLTVPATIAVGAAALVLLVSAVIGSHEEICFKTLNGRAKTVRLVAGLGTIGRFRRLMPVLAEAIAAAGERVDDDESVYLRAEMHEHYRLRRDGVLSDDECSDATGRILDNFDEPR